MCGIDGFVLKSLPVLLPPRLGVDLAPPWDFERCRQTGADLGGTLRPVVGVLGQALHHQCLELERQLTPEPLGRRGRLGVQVVAADLDDVAGEDLLTRQHEVAHRPQGIQIAAAIHGVRIGQSLGRQVLRCAGHHPIVRQIRVLRFPPRP